MRFHWQCFRKSKYRNKVALHSQLVPPSPPRAVQSTAIRSASPVSTVKGASMNTERDDRSRISIVGSYALRGRLALASEAPTVEDGWRSKRSGVELYGVN